MIRKIVTHNNPVYLISPHLDDAVFSAGGLMSMLKNRATVVNIFTHTEGSHTLSAKAFLRQSGETDAEKLYTKRRNEDKKAVSSLGASVMDLGYTDALWRRTTPSKWNFLGAMIPELEVVYPTYRLHIGKGKVSKKDNYVIDELVVKLRSIVKEENAIVFCPIGYGDHVDHIVVRTACERAFARERLVYWLDFPYSIRSNVPVDYAKKLSLIPVQLKHDGKSKLKTCKMYKTQYSHVVGDDKAVNRPETFYFPKSTVPLGWRERLHIHTKAMWISPKDYVFNLLFSDKGVTVLKPFSQETKKVALSIIKEIKDSIPDSECKLIGSTGLGIEGQGDIDILIPVNRNEIENTSSILTRLFGKPDKYGRHLIQWKRRIHGKKVDLDLIDQDGERYREQIKLFSILHSNQEAKNTYRQFKLRTARWKVRDFAAARAILLEDLLKKYAHFQVMPEKIGEYHYVRSLGQVESKTYDLGLYQSGGKQVVAKIWNGSKRSREYKFLKNEINAYKTLHGSIARLHSREKMTLAIPDLVLVTETRHMLAMLITYIPGRDLSQKSGAAKVETFIDISAYLHNLTYDNKYQLLQRGPLYWYCMLPAITVLAMMRHPRKWKVILRALLFAFVRWPKMIGRPKCFVHRDYNDQNVIEYGGKIHLIDFQLASIADPLMDYAVLFLKYFTDKGFMKSLMAHPAFERLMHNQKSYTVLRSYIAILVIADLSVPDGRHAVSSACLDWLFQTRKPKEVKIERRTGKVYPTLMRILGMVAVTSTVVAITILSIRGRMGVPADYEFKDPRWEQNGPFELSPERGRFALTYSILEQNSVYFSVDTARFVLPDLGYKNGHYVSLFAPGVSYLIAPGYILGKIWGASQVGSFAMISIFALCNFFMIRVLAKYIGASGPASTLAGLVFLFATPAYAYAVNLYQHHISTFLILTSLYLAIRFTSFISLALIWFLVACSIPVDYPNLILMLPIAVYAGTRIISAHVTARVVSVRFHIVRVLSCVTAAVPLAFFLWFNQTSYGNPLQFSGTVPSVPTIDAAGNPVADKTKENYSDNGEYNPEETRKNAVGFFEPRKMVNGLYIHIFSPDRGIIRFTPVILLGVLGIFTVYKKNKNAAVLISGVAIADILLYSMWGDPWGGWAFGSRYLIPAYALLALAIGPALAVLRKNIIFMLIFITLLGYSVYVNTAGALSTSANPPQVQILSLEEVTGRRERYSFDRNIEFLQAGNSKSFVYQTWLSEKVSAWDYFRIVSGAIVGLMAILIARLYIGRAHDQL